MSSLFERIKKLTKPASTTPCPLEKGTVIVELLRSDTGAAVADASANLEGPTPGTGKTDHEGLAVFEDRDPGPYQATVTLPGALVQKKYILEKVKPSGSVAANGFESLLFTTSVVGNLVVEVYDDRGKLLDELADLAGAGPESLGQSVPKGGSHKFLRVKCGDYDVSASVSADRFETAVVRTQAKVKVPEGGDGYARLEVKRLVSVVTPKIEMEYKVVLLDRKLSAHQASTEKKILTDDVTHIQVSASQTPGPIYLGDGKFEVAPANVEVYIDKACKNKLVAGKILNRDLLSKFDLYLKATTKGKFKAKLTLDASKDPYIQVKGPAEEEMGVVELEAKLHQFDKTALDALEVVPDVEPIATYHTALKAKPLPDQKEMTDAQKVTPGRLLHVKIDNNHGRAKLIVKKLDAGQWPGGTDDYDIVMNESLADGGAGSVTLFDKETEGTEKPLPHKIKVKDLKAKDFEFWVEGKATNKAWRDIVLDAGFDRDVGGLAKVEKRNGDWERFTVVKITEVKVDYTPEAKKPVAWDESTHRFYINFKDDPNGRKVTIGATIEPKLKGVSVRLMLAPDENNLKKANWGVDLPVAPVAWVWKDIEAAVKHTDKTERKKVLHLSDDTDDKGYAKKELILSRFGGDVFHPGAYIDQDPHLAKYVHGHTDLQKRKPVVAAYTVTVWRKFWYEEVKVTGLDVAGFGNAATTYEDVKVVMEAAPVLEMPRATANGLSPSVIYPKHMLSYYVDPTTNKYVNNYSGDTGDGLAVGDATEKKFFALSKPSTERPVKIPVLNAHALWVKKGPTSTHTTPWIEMPAKTFPIPLSSNRELIDPPLQGGTLYKTGRWEAEDWDAAANSGTGAWVNPRNEALIAADISLDPARNSPKQYRISKPAGLVLATKTRVRMSGVTLNGAESFLGTSYSDGIVNSYTPNDVVDFINTINHEIGHSFKQVAKVRPAGIPAQTHQYDKDGSHCNYQDKSCLMYESGPQAIHLDRYCPVCHPYVLVQDMSKV